LESAVERRAKSVEAGMAVANAREQRLGSFHGLAVADLNVIGYEPGALDRARRAC